MMTNEPLVPIYLSSEEYKIYARHIVLNKIGIKGQIRIKKARILIIGAGGLGCPGILYLVASGIGHIGIVDDDRVSLSNLHRQILYTKFDIGKFKVQCIKNKFKNLNPDCNIEIYTNILTEINSINIIRQYDIVLDTSDNFKTRYTIELACKRLHKVHIYGAVQNFEGHISVFNYKNGPEYSDLYPNHLSIEGENCNESGIMGVLTGIIGIIQVSEAIKVITGIGKVFSGYLLVYNMLEMSFKRKRIRPQFNNLIAKQKNKINRNNSLTITANGLNKKLQKEKDIVIIDVRQQTEFNQQHINNAINIPLQEILYKKATTTTGILNQIQNKTLIIYCSQNSRSIIASSILDKNNISNTRLKNGLIGYIQYNIT